MDLFPNLSFPPVRQIGNTFLDATNFGTAGDGLRDDTAAIQKAIDALPKSGGTVYLPPGAYLIDPLRSLRARSYFRLHLAAGAKLIAMTTDKPRSRVILVEDCEEVELLLNGDLLGDRDTHNYVDTGSAERTHEWNHGVWVRGTSKNVTIMGGGTVRDFAGDGFSVAGTDIWVYGMKGVRNRRQGCTVGRGKGIRVVGNEFTDTFGTGPSAGIDIEPDAPGGAEDVLIENNKLLRNKGPGLLIITRIEPNGAPSATVHGVKAYGNEIAYNINGVETARVDGLDIMGNEVHDNTASGVKVGSATGIHLAENKFKGNYSRLAVRVREAMESFGWFKAMDRDILITSAAGDNVRIGRNYLEAQQPAT